MQQRNIVRIQHRHTVAQQAAVLSERVVGNGASQAGSALKDKGREDERVGPVVSQTVVGADRRLTISGRVPGDTGRRSKLEPGIVVQLPFTKLETIGRMHAQREPLFRTQDDVVRSTRRHSHLPTQTEIHGQVAG